MLKKYLNMPLIGISMTLLLSNPLYALDTLATLPKDQKIGEIELVTNFYEAMPTGVTVTDSGRIFVNFPRWGDKVPYTVAEVKGNKTVPYPNISVNRADDQHPDKHFLSVQSVVSDHHNRLWVLDTAAPKFSTPIANGVKLVAIDLNTDKVLKTIIFPKEVILPTTYVNDVRFDFKKGKSGVAYVTDSSTSGPGGIIVIDLDSGKAIRRLSGDKSTSADKDFVPVIEGVKQEIKNSDGSSSPFTVASDGIALSPDGEILYYSPLSSRHLYSIETKLLRDPNVTEEALSLEVKDMGEKGASDGLETDQNGAIYAGDYERNSIRKLPKGGDWITIAHGPEILWPDTLSVAKDGYLYFTVNQLHRQPTFHAGKDLRIKPYSLLRIKIN